MEFISRANWGHPDPDNPGGYYLGVQRLKYLVQHHTPNQEPTGLQDAYAQVLSIYRQHTQANGWQDIGYTFLVWDRYVFEGRGFGQTGAHAPGANSISIGVAFIMDGRFRKPTATEELTLRELADVAIEHGYLLEQHELTGHRDWVQTECPGQMAYDHLSDYWLVSPGPFPAPEPQPSEEHDVYEFDQRAGGPFPWKVDAIDYTPWGGADVWDFPDVQVGDRIVVATTVPDAGEAVVSVFYPSAKQTEAKAVRWGRPVQFVAEEPGFVSVLCSANVGGRLRVIGRS